MESNKRRKKSSNSTDTDDDENVLLAYGTLRRPFKKYNNKKLKTNLSNLWRKSLNEINFIDSYCKLKPFNLNKNYSKDDLELNNEVNSIEPDRIVDCLSDLDAYLDAIDINNYEELNNINDDTSKLIKRNNFNIHNNFCTFPKKKTKIPIDRNNYTIDEDRVNENVPSTSRSSVPFQRHHPQRNTTLPTSKHKINNENQTEIFPQRRLSWLRNSMRKTRPIIMPDQTGLPHHETNQIQRNDNSLHGILPEVVNNTDSIRNEITSIDNSLDNAHANSDIENNRNIRHTFSDSNFPLDIFDNRTNVRDRPRQMGRRSEMFPRLVSITAENITNGGNQSIILNHEQPRENNSEHTTTTTTTRHFIESELSSQGSTRNPSPVSIVSSTGSSSIASAVDTNERPRERLSTSSTDAEDVVTDPDERNGFKKWPHQYGRALATICCTLGLFNISRFSVFSIHFGANFVLQFLILSLIIGIPMLWLQMCLGAKIKNGPISMWRISPICKGISISLFLGQGLIALYSTISIGWLVVYFRDSFLSNTLNYRWEEVYELYRYGNESVSLSAHVSDYFNGVVLQRLQLGPGGRAGSTGIGPVRFQIAFNISLVWMLIFVILCKGLRSYGKCLFVFATAPIILITVVTVKLLFLVDSSSIQDLYPATDWQEFFSNSQSWFTAAQETFLTWNLFGISVISFCSKTNKTLTKNKKLLKRDAYIVIFVTIFVLLVASLLGNACFKILNDSGFYYFPGSSYETLASNVFLFRKQSLHYQSVFSIPTKYLPRFASVLGETFRQPGVNHYKESGYQAIRLVTEILPCTFSVSRISWIWCMLIFLALLLFGVGQLCAIWKPVASLLGNSPSSVLLSCVTGLLLGIPLATESGINIIHFFDIVLGGAWWMLVLWVAQILAIFLIRGRPYSADLLVNDLHFSPTLSAFVAFSWNLLIPIVLMMLCAIEYKSSNTRELFHKKNPSYWPLWVRQMGAILQVSFLVLVPITSIIQIYRYLSKGPPDVLDRIQLLYRPHLYPISEHRPVRRVVPPSVPTITQTAAERAIDRPVRQSDVDAPPKYTPPPSYTTATGARIAKMLRQSIRRSVRRLMGEPSRNRLTIPIQQTESHIATDHTSLPPDYTSVFSSNIDSNSVPSDIPTNQDSINLEMGLRRPPTTNPQPVSSIHLTDQSNNTQRQQTLTAHDVAQLLRPNRNKSHRTFSLGRFNSANRLLRNTNNQRLQEMQQSQQTQQIQQNGLSVSLENVFINDNNNLTIPKEN